MTATFGTPFISYRINEILSIYKMDNAMAFHERTYVYEYEHDTLTPVDNCGNEINRNWNEFSIY